MTKKDLRAEYPEIEALYSKIKQKEIELTLLPRTSALKAISFQEIHFQNPTYSCAFPVEDEYEDAADNNPAILFQLILYSILEYEDCDDFLVWSKSFGLNASDLFSLDLYRRTGEIVPKIRAIIGYDFTGISDYDWQLNAGAAQALRELDP